MCIPIPEGTYRSAGTWRGYIRALVPLREVRAGAVPEGYGCTFYFFDRILLQCDSVKSIRNLLRRRRCDQADDHIDDNRYDESRKQFIDTEDAASGTDGEFPDKDHGAAGDHAEKCAPLIGTFPEQSQQHDRSEAGTETGPGEGYDHEDGTVAVPCKDYAEYGNDGKAKSRDQKQAFLADMDPENICKQVA